MSCIFLMYFIQAEAWWCKLF